MIFIFLFRIIQINLCEKLFILYFALLFIIILNKAEK